MRTLLVVVLSLAGLAAVGCQNTTLVKTPPAPYFGPRVAARVILLEILTAAFAGLGWPAFGQAQWLLASVPVILIGLPIIHGVLTLPPGLYTVQAVGAGAATGVILIEIYDLGG